MNVLYIYLRTDDGSPSSMIWQAFTKKCVDSIPKLFEGPRLKNITGVSFAGSFPVMDKYGHNNEEDITALIITRAFAATIKWEDLTLDDAVKLLSDEDEGEVAFWVHRSFKK